MNEKTDSFPGSLPAPHFPFKVLGGPCYWNSRLVERLATSGTEEYNNLAERGPGLILCGVEKRAEALESDQAGSLPGSDTMRFFIF